MAEVHFGEGGTFERRRGREVVQSRIDFVVTSPDSGWTDEGADWVLSDHSSIGGSLVIDEVRMTDSREVVDWDRLAVTLADEDEGWYRELVGKTAYDKLLDLTSAKMIYGLPCLHGLYGFPRLTPGLFGL